MCAPPVEGLRLLFSGDSLFDGVEALLEALAGAAFGAAKSEHGAAAPLLVLEFSGG